MIETQQATFTSFLDGIQDGDFADEVTSRLRALVREMSDTARNAGGKPKGRIVVSLELKLDGGIFEVVADVNVKPPKPVRSRSIFYPTPDHGLVVNNPRQLPLPLEARDVTGSPRSEIRVVG